jgi:hypothetical protein
MNFIIEVREIAEKDKDHKAIVSNEVFKCERSNEDEHKSITQSDVAVSTNRDD